MSATRSRLRVAAAIGLLASAAGIGLMKLGGAEMPLVPPGAVLLVVAAVLLMRFRGRWAAAFAVLVGLAEVAGILASGSLSGIADDGALETAGTLLRCAGVIIAVLAGTKLLIRRPALSTT